MNAYQTIFDLYQNILTGFGEFWTFLITPLPALGYAPIFLFTAVGIIGYIIIAIGLWVIK